MASILQEWSAYMTRWKFFSSHEPSMDMDTVICRSAYTCTCTYVYVGVRIVFTCWLSAEQRRKVRGHLGITWVLRPGASGAGTGCLHRLAAAQVKLSMWLFRFQPNGPCARKETTGTDLHLGTRQANKHSVWRSLADTWDEYFRLGRHDGVGVMSSAYGRNRRGKLSIMRAVLLGVRERERKKKDRRLVWYAWCCILAV